jgi:predicted site-specific integrase-resolvase
MINNNKYLSTKETKKIMNVHTHTLYNWEKKGEIETIRTKTGRRLYNVEKYLKNKKDNKKMNICYVRVSTIGQKDDLLRQRNYMKNKYPKYEIIQDIGSGINFNRKGLVKIIDYAIEGKINKLVIA